MLAHHASLFAAAGPGATGTAVTLRCPRRASAWRAAIGDRMSEEIVKGQLRIIVGEGERRRQVFGEALLQVTCLKSWEQLTHERSARIFSKCP